MRAILNYPAIQRPCLTAVDRGSESMKRKWNRILDWMFRVLATWNGLWCLAMVDKLERDITYPLGKGTVLIAAFLALTVLCLWLGNCYPEWLGVRPFVKK